MNLKELYSKIMEFATTEDFGFDVIKRQLRALWTSFCLCADYEVDTCSYDNDLLNVWNYGVSENRTNTFADFDTFDMFMCADLV